MIPSRLIDECFAAIHNKFIFFAYLMAGDGDLRLKFFFYSFIYFWLCWVFFFFFFFGSSGFSLVAASGDYSLVAVHGLLIEEASLAAEHGL